MYCQGQRRCALVSGLGIGVYGALGRIGPPRESYGGCEGLGCRGGYLAVLHSCGRASLQQNLHHPHLRMVQGRRWSSNPSGKCSYVRPTRGTVCGTMRSMCGADAGCLAINYQSLYGAGFRVWGVGSWRTVHVPHDTDAHHTWLSRHQDSVTKEEKTEENEYFPKISPNEISAKNNPGIFWCE